MTHALQVLKLFNLGTIELVATSRLLKRAFAWHGSSEGSG